MRCLSLAQGCRRAGDVLFAIHEIPPALAQRLQRLGVPATRIAAAPGSREDAAETGRLARAIGADWVVADGYRFADVFQRGVKDAGARLLLVDDYGHAEHYCADLVLNQNLSADERFYRQRATCTQLLLGTRYVLLRRQFQAYMNWRRAIVSCGRRVLVSLGGADPEDLTGKVVAALRNLEVEARVVVGGSNPHFSSLSCAMPPGCTLIRDAENMPELMAWADVAVAAGGTTAWELAFMGLPSLLLVLAGNQQPVVEALAREGVAVRATVAEMASALPQLLMNAGRRAAMAARGRQIVDGHGIGRVEAHLLAATITLRRARQEDCGTVWKWANEAQTRAVSLSPHPIPWETHVAWFAAHIGAPACRFYIATDRDGSMLGQIRYDIDGDEAVVSVGIARELRGRGYGPALIVRGTAQLFADSAVKRIRAHIRPENVASLSAFDRAGYRENGEVHLGGVTVRALVLERQA